MKFTIQNETENPEPEVEFSLEKTMNGVTVMARHVGEDHPSRRWHLVSFDPSGEVFNHCAVPDYLGIDLDPEDGNRIVITNER